MQEKSQNLDDDWLRREDDLDQDIDDLLDEDDLIDIDPDDEDELEMEEYKEIVLNKQTKANKSP